MTRTRYARIFWIGAAGTLVLAALIGISSLLQSDFSETDGQILLTLLTLLVSAGTVVAGLTLVDRGRTGVGWAVVAVAIAAGGLICAATWNSFDDSGLAKLAGAAAFVLIATLLGATQLVLHRGRHAWLVATTWLLLAIAALTSSAALMNESSGEAWKIAASIWIMGVVAWLNLPLLQRLQSAEAAGERVLAELDGIELIATRSAAGIAVDLGPGERVVLRRRG